MRARVGTIQCPAATGEQATTGVGFTPQALVFFYTTRTSDGTSPDAQLGLGVATASDRAFAVALQGEDNAATSNTGRAASTVVPIRLYDAGAAARVLNAALVSLDHDGFTLDWEFVTEGADVHYLALGELADARAHAFSAWTGTGAQGVTGVGFQPQAVLALVGYAAAADAGSLDGSLGLGVTDGTAQAALSLALDDNAATGLGGRYFADDALLATLANGAATLNGAAGLTAFGADGFTVDVADAWGTAVLGNALCLRGLSAKAGTLTVPAATGDQATTGVGFRPVALFCFGAHAAADGVAAAGFSGFVGAAAAPTQQAVVFADYEEGADPTVADHGSDTTACVRAITAGTPTTDYAASLASFDADGFTLDWTTADGVGTDEVAYLALGYAAGTGPPNRAGLGGRLGAAPVPHGRIGL
jgi:hypothetical protein